MEEEKERNENRIERWKREIGSTGVGERAAYTLRRGGRLLYLAE